MKEIDYNAKVATREGQNELVNAMHGLKRSKGWAVAHAYLSRLRVLIQSQINNIDNPLTQEDLLRKRIELHYIDWLLDFPDDLIKTFSEDDEEEDQEVEEMEVY
jgi:hypothetical protein